MTPVHHLRKTRTALVVSLIAATLALVPASPALAVTKGTYVLEQVSTLTELDNQASAIQSALATTGVLGLTVRVPWTSLEPTFGVYDFSIFDRARQIAGTKRLTVRFIAGRYTPSFRMGRYMVYDGSESGGLGAGSKVPLPFQTNGQPNWTFENGWKALADKIISWANSHSVKLIHFSWPGLLWAELALTNQMMRQSGYSYAVVRDLHFRLVDYALSHTDTSTSVEFPSTGHCPNSLLMDIRSHILASQYSWRAILQSNNVSPTSGGVMGTPPRRGAQVVSASNTYNWYAVYTKVREMSAEYVEVYTPSFTGGTSYQLRQEIARFYQAS
jgi:hypothetical protein